MQQGSFCKHQKAANVIPNCGQLMQQQACLPICLLHQPQRIRSRRCSCVEQNGLDGVASHSYSSQLAKPKGLLAGGCFQLQLLLVRNTVCCVGMGKCWQPGLLAAPASSWTYRRQLQVAIAGTALT